MSDDLDRIRRLADKPTTNLQGIILALVAIAERVEGVAVQFDYLTEMLNRHEVDRRS